MTRASVFWSAVRNSGQRVGTILTFILLARLLSPAEIGTFAAAAAIIALLELFADNGLGDAVVQSNRMTGRIASALLVVNLAIAVCLYAGVLLFAFNIGAFLGASGADDILRVSAMVLIFNALSYVPQALLRKEFQFQRLAFRALASTFAGAATGLSMALLGYGVWSMAGQLIITALINLTLAWYPSVLRVSVPDFKGAAALIQFGMHVFAARILYFSSSRLIEVVIPAFFGPAALGLYLMGSRLPAVLAQMISAVMVDVSLPHYSKLAHDQEALRPSFFANVELSAAIAMATFLGLGALAPEVSAVAFGPNGAGSEALMLPLAVLGALQAIGFYNGVILNASGYPNIHMQISLVTSGLTALMFFALKDTNIEAFVYGFVSAQSLMVVIGFFMGARYTGLPLKRLFLTCAPFLLAGSLALGLVTILRWYAKDYIEIALLRGAGLGIAFSATYVLFLVIIDRKALKRVVGTIFKRHYHPWPGGIT